MVLRFLVYESPLLTLQNTQLLQHAATISHSVSSAQLPSLKPRALVNHAASLAKYGWQTVFGSSSSASSSLASASSSSKRPDKQTKTSTPHEQRYRGTRTNPSHDFAISTSHDATPYNTVGSSHQLSSRRGHTALASAFARYYIEPDDQPYNRPDGATVTHNRSKGKGKQVADGDEHWWRAWDVRSVCGEVNEMETYGQSEVEGGLCHRNEMLTSSSFLISQMGFISDLLSSRSIEPLHATSS